MRVIKKVQELRQALALLREGDKKVAFVPTMGALHAGHFSLIKQAQKVADIVVVSIFVNPKQFGPDEDFSAYPRQEEKDLALLAEQGVHIAYTPTAATMYKPRFCTSVAISGVLSSGLCGAVRPGHFEGVVLVVTKLLLQIAPDIAIFGEKDYQQLMVVRQLVSDLDIDVKIISAPILREKDGLAMSSRNVYLTASERTIAPELYKVLKETAATISKDPASPLEATLEKAKKTLLDKGFNSVDYLELRDSKTLATLTTKTAAAARLLVVAHLGSCRLLDNIEVK